MKFRTHISYSIDQLESQYGNTIYRILEDKQYYKFWSGKPSHTKADYVPHPQTAYTYLEFETLEEAREWVKKREVGLRIV
jgi:hypothetical protein